MCAETGFSALNRYMERSLCEQFPSTHASTHKETLLLKWPCAIFSASAHAHARAFASAHKKTQLYSFVWSQWTGWEWCGKHGVKTNRLFFTQGFVGEQTDVEQYSKPYWQPTKGTKKEVTLSQSRPVDSEHVEVWWGQCPRSHTKVNCNQSFAWSLELGSWIREKATCFPILDEDSWPHRVAWYKLTSSSQYITVHLATALNLVGCNMHFCLKSNSARPCLSHWFGASS